jgi:hypothetical protein
MAKSKKETAAIEIQEISMGRLRCNIVGTTPMIMHRFSKKAQGELLLPKGPINRAEKAAHLKHDPINEFRETIYLNRDNSTPTRVHLPSNAFSKALANAALDIPGASKSQMLRLTSVVSTQINLFGIPKLHMGMVRSSDMARTPDVRTRAIFPEWACSIEIEFVSSLIKEKQVINLLAAAGIIVGIGDWRPQKGGAFGKFRVADDRDAEFLKIVKNGARPAQIKAIAEADPYDAEAEELLAWFKSEVKKRDRVVPSDSHEGDAPTAVRARKRKDNGASANL